MDQKRKIGWITASAIVVANMVGTGAFTSLGFQLKAIQNTWSIFILWSIGGLTALCGALSYAELGTRFPKSGGEYHFLSQIYHPFLGYLSGWVSFTVGFSAPVALAAMAMGAYTEKYVPFSGTTIASAAVIAATIIHSFDIRQSSLFQNFFTLLKIVLLLFFIAAAMSYSPAYNALNWGEGWRDEWQKPAFAVALVYVSYSFSGWNAAAYIVEEINNVNKNLPRSLIIGTLVVSILYILLQIAFLNQASLDSLIGKEEVGQIVAEQMLGPFGGQLISSLISLILISSISALIWVGPRVTQAMAVDVPTWRYLGKKNKNGIPVRAIWLQTGLSLILIATNSFELVLLYSGFVLQLFTTITIAGLFIVRLQKTTLTYYKSPFFPIPQIIFLAVSVWILFFMMLDKPGESLVGMANLIIGAITYWLVRRIEV